MFDIGFWELVLIGVVALIVVGPERLPKLARATGLWIGRAQASLQSIKNDINRELRAQELNDALKNIDRSRENQPSTTDPQAENSDNEQDKSADGK